MKTAASNAPRIIAARARANEHSHLFSRVAVLSASALLAALCLS
jgi:hypothetical protein